MAKPQFVIRHLSFVSALAALAGTAFADQTNLMSYLTGAWRRAPTAWRLEGRNAGTDA